jgi:hypothetical protein
MAYFKIVRKTLEINGSSRSTSIDLRAEVFSYDKNVSKFLFELTSKEAEIDLTGATVRVLLTYVGNDGKKGIIEDNGGVEANTINQIYYLLPEELRGYDGTVVMGLYVDLPSGEAIDIQNVQFRMFKSSIDDGAGVAGVIYFKSFEEWLFQVKEKALLEIQNIDEESERITKYADTKIKEYDEKFVQSNQKMSELQQSQIELSDQLDETNKKIDEADVYRKDEVFNKPESSANVIYQIVSGKKEKIVFSPNFSGKVSGSLVENANSAYIAYSTALNAPTAGTWYEFSDERYSKISDLDDIRDVGSHKVNGQMVLIRIEYDVVDILTSVYSNNFWLSQGISTLDEKVTYIKNNVSEITPHVFGFGSGPSGNRLQLVTWRPDTKVWNDNGVTAINSTNQVKDIYAKHSPVVVDQYGKINILLYSYVSDGTIPSGTSIDYSELEIALNISANEHIESMFAANQVESIATGEEAEAGESNSVFMTPNLVFKAIAKWVQGKFVSTAGNETILGTKNFQDGIQVKGKLPVLTKSVNDYASVDKNNNASVISDGSMRLYRRGDIVYLTGSFKLSAAKYNQAVWFNVPSWAAPIDRPRMYWSSGSNFYLLAFDPSTINNIICIDNVAQDTWLTGSFCWLARDPY